jgi:heme exporter protein A
LLEPLIGRGSGRTRVLVTHDVARGIAEADVVIGLRSGRVEVAGAASSSAALQAEGLFA